MSHVPRVCAFGHGNTSSRTPLIILVFGEFGASDETTAFKFQLRKKASRKLALWFRDKTPSRKSGVSKI